MTLPMQNNVTDLTAFIEQQNGQQTSPLAQLKKSPDWKLLSRPVQRGLEAAEAQTVAVNQTLKEFNQGVQELSGEHRASVVSSMNRWNGVLDELGSAATEEERDALTNQKGHEFVGLMVAYQESLNTLQELHRQNNARILDHEPHEWVPKTSQEKIEEFVTFGESELARRGLPPLTLKESLLNTISFGLVAEKKLRDDEISRMLGKSARQPETTEPGVIDADFTAY